MTANGISSPGHAEWRRRRRLRILTVLGGLLLVVGVITVWPRSGDEGIDELATSPYREGSTTVDTSPFALVRDEDAPSTIPDDQLTTTLALPPPTTAQPTTPPPSTTSTVPPSTTTTLPRVAARDHLCKAILNFYKIVLTAPSLLDRPLVLRQLAEDRLTDAIRELRLADERRYATEISLIESIRTNLRDAQTREQLDAAMKPLIGGATDPRLAELRTHGRENCPELPVSG